ncbi:multiple C2 and transmembrane domain-containing protein 1-like isoform X3 [Ornithodoros turicata]|uniref:multiple C2 and transmembrane domain-containing protein 1-like isoform X3 n=1 Tax=Ornithodoros turicata TaxID=34597 RepID=UPI003138AE19
MKASSNASKQAVKSKSPVLSEKLSSTSSTTAAPAKRSAKKQSTRGSSPGKTSTEPQTAATPPMAIATKDTIASILLLKGCELEGVDDVYLCDPYVVFQIGAEHYTSRVIREASDPVWNEKFDIFISNGKSMVLDVIIMDKNENASTQFIARFRINLAKYNYNTTYEVRQDLDDDAGRLFFQVTLLEPNRLLQGDVFDLPSFTTLYYMRREIAKKYGWSVFGDWSDIGQVMLIVYMAKDVAARHLEDRINPFCVVELADKKIHSDIQKSTINPVWNCLIRIRKIPDLHAALQITVLNDFTRQEFLGTIAFPLVMMERRKMLWFPLKDEYLSTDTGGEIFIEFDMIYNPIRAALRSFQEKPAPPAPLADTSLARETLTRNVRRTKNLFKRYVAVKNLFLKSFDWESVPLSAFSFSLVWLSLYLQPYMLPWLGIVGLIVIQVAIKYWNVLEPPIEEKRRSSLSLSERLAGLQEAAEAMQNTLGKGSSIGERILNALTFRYPYVSRMLIVLLVVSGFLCYYVHLRYWILIWVLHKHWKGFRRYYLGKLGEARQRTNKIWNLISRTPDDYEQSRYSKPKPGDPQKQTEPGYITRSITYGRP